MLINAYIIGGHASASRYSAPFSQPISNRLEFQESVSSRNFRNGEYPCCRTCWSSRHSLPPPLQDCPMQLTLSISCSALSLSLHFHPEIFAVLYWRFPDGHYFTAVFEKLRDFPRLPNLIQEYPRRSSISRANIHPHFR